MKGMLSIPEGVLCMADKPKLTIPFNVVDGWFDDISRAKVFEGLYQLHAKVARYVDFEAMGVMFQGQEGWKENFFGIVLVKPNIKGLTMSSVGFYRGPKKLNDFEFSPVYVVGDEKLVKKETPGISTISLEDAVVVWEKEFKDFLKQYLNQEIYAYKNDLEKFQEHLDFLLTGKWPDSHFDI